ncbi:hypothetical protein KUTeg_002326 [Tegillarca granosa]|uniref:C2H2-type domain-containing protein n=1 Tax=Tegillarca granosa TaxID=220873 RepID=A0ABQ9FU12_TEGGR|nr:hypothetical protein KUTeg_002326 [Tegillarca granosa]
MNEDGCDKVYISTSDVQMHANYHRKDSAIIQEGFQRFRATEDCGTLTCAFYGQRTTHFHCRRNSCNFTFKNKADMEKHKTYHQKDEVLGRDGFKKFMKYEHCGYYGCRYSKVSNHIHCIRKGKKYFLEVKIQSCNYVLHSTAQLYSHKRKHERRDFEAAYRKYREDGNGKDGPESVSMATQIQLSDSNSMPLSIKKEPFDDSDMGDDFDMDDSLDSSSHMADSEGIKMEADFEDNSSDVMSSAISEASDSNVGNLSTCTDDSVKVPEKETKAFNISDHMPNMSGDKLDGSLTLPIPNYNSPSTNQTIIKKEATSPQEATPALAQPKLPVFVPTSVLPPHTVTAIPLPARPPERMLERREKDESWKNYLIRYTANDPCNSRCQYLYKDHYHCKVEGCLVLFKSKDGVREHASIL